MKVLILLPIFKNTGPSNVVLSLLKAMNHFSKEKEQNTEFYLVSMLPCQDNYADKLQNLPVTLIELGGFNLKSFRQLRAIIKQRDIDVVHSHCLLPDIAAPIVASFTQAKTISTIHCNLNDNYRNEYSLPKGPVYYGLHRLFLALSNQLVCVSSSAQLSKKIPIVYNGICARKIAPESSECLNIVFAGRLIASKNIVFLLDSFKTLQDKMTTPVKLHLFGDGELKAELENKCAKEQIDNVVFHGFVSDYLAQVPANSIVANPSLFEGMPMSVVEAISVNLPVVLSDISAHREIAQHIGAGVQLHKNSSEAFVGAIEKLIDKQGKVIFNQDQLQQNFAKCFSSQVMAQQYYDFYQQLAV